MKSIPKLPENEIVLQFLLGSKQTLPNPDKRIFLHIQIFIAMYRYFFRFAVTSITILTATLLTNAISNYMITYKNHYKPFTFTLVGMGVIIVIFYPLFIKLEEWVKNISVKVVRSGNSFAGKYLGLPLTFLVCLLVLFHLYAKMWYHIDFFQALLHGNIGMYL
jgi:hypothetical protein